MQLPQVRSMYSHCQAPTGYQRRQSELSGKSHPDISLVDWLTLYVNTSSAWEQSARRCSFNPVNFQTHILAAPNGDVQSVGRERRSRSWKTKSVFHDRSDFVFPQGRFLVPAHVLDRLHSLIQTAFFVGVTEYYAHSLCLVRWLVTGQLPASGCAATVGTEMNHNDHGNAAGTRGLSGEELSLIAQVTRIDELVYGFGLERMYRDARKANLPLH